jgi:hypothetical protein
MASSLVEELQMDAINRDVRVSDFLRKALLVSSKLDIPGVPSWIDKELSGYEGTDDTPPYRKLYGRVVARTIRGWVPVQFPTTDLQASVAEQTVYQSVAEIEELLAANEELRCNFSPEGQHLLQQLFRAETEFTCMHSRASLAAILDEVRSRILRWSMELSKAGIRGDGLTFTQQEKRVAHNIVVEGVMNVGVIGDVHSATNIAVGERAHAGNVEAKDIQELVSAIEPHVSSVALPAAEKVALVNVLEDLKQQGAKGNANVSKLRPIFRRMLQVVGKISDDVLSAGIKVVVETWMKAHGMVP